MSWSSVICHSKNEKVLFFSLCVCPCVLLLQPYYDLLSLLLLESLHCGVQLSCLLLFSLINNLTNLILYFCMLCFKQERTSVGKKKTYFEIQNVKQQRVVDGCKWILLIKSELPVLGFGSPQLSRTNITTHYLIGEVLKSDVKSVVNVS